MPSTIIVYDFETTSTDPNTCQPVQLAALPIDYTTLKYDIKNAFSFTIKPSNFDIIDPKVIDWHCKNLKISKEKLLTNWKNASDLKSVWDNFLLFIKRWNVKGTKWEAPIRAGHNIVKYDDIIIERLRQEFSPKQEHLFHPRDYLDTMNIAYLWLESLPEPNSYSMEKLMDFHGYDEVSKSGAHEALSDCVNCARLLCHYLKLHRGLAPKVQFKKAFCKPEC